MSLEHLLQRSDLWRGGTAPLADPARTQSSGHPALDAELGGGWPLGALTELLTDRHGIGELSLLLPALAALTRAGQWLAFIGPPYLPYAPALAQGGLELTRMVVVETREEQESLWALEQSLRAGVSVLGWPRQPAFATLRRLQLAAEAGKGLAVLYRPEGASRHPSPAALRIALAPEGERLALRILKRRGATGSARVALRAL